MALMTSTQFSKLLTTGLTKIEQESSFKDIPPMIPRLFDVMTSEKAWEEFYSLSSVPDIEQFNGSLNYLDVAPGYHIVIEPREYANGLQFQRKLIDDNQYNVLKDMVSELLAAATRTREKSAARAFTTADSVAYDFITKNEEGVAWASNSHTTKVAGVSTTTGFDNYGTSALTKTSVAVARLAMRNFRDSNGNQIDMNDNFALLVPDALAEAAHEINFTMTGLDDAEGNANFHYKRYEIIPWQRLDTSSSTTWYMVNLTMLKRYLHWINRIAPETKTQLGDFETFVLKYSIYFRDGYGATGWRCMYMNKPA
jgi:hypothetical protein